MTNKYYEFFCPVKVVAGKAALEHIPFELNGLGAQRPMISTDKGVRAAGLLEPVITACEESELEIVSIYDGFFDITRDVYQHGDRASQGCS